MNPANALLIVALLAATALCAAGVWAMIRVGSSARAVEQLANDSRQRLVPLLDKADVTVDAINAELLRVDMILTRLDETTTRLSSASDTVSDIVNVPERLAEGIAERVRTWSKRKQDESTVRRAEAKGETTDVSEDGTDAERLEAGTADVGAPVASTQDEQDMTEATWQTT